MCVALLVACDEDPRQAAQGHFEQASAYYQQGEIQAAVIELKNTLQANPNHGDGRVLLGWIYLRTGQGSSAVKEFEKARNIGQLGDDMRLLLIRALLQEQSYEEVLNEIPEDLSLESPAGRRLWVERGRALIGLRQIEAARAVFDEILAREALPGAYAGLARIAILAPDLEAAEARLAEGLERFPSDPELLILEAERLMIGQEFERAEDVFAQATDLNEYLIHARLGRVRAAIAQGELDEASEQFAELPEPGKETQAAVFLRALIAFHEQDWETARSAAEKLLIASADDLAAVFIAGASSYSLEQNERALDLLERYVSQVPHDQSARRLLASTQLRLGDPEAAHRTLQEGQNGKELDANYLALLSTTAELTGDRLNAVRYLEEALLRSPDDGLLQARLGLAKIAAGQTEGGEADLKQAAVVDPNVDSAQQALQARTAVILGYIREREFDLALQAARELQRDHPNAPSALVLEGIVHLGLAAEGDARSAFEKALDLEPGNPDASLNLAALEQRQGNNEAALALLEGVLDRNPDHYLTLLRLADLTARLNRPADAKAWLQRVLDSRPGDLQASVALARLHLRSGEPDKALAAARPLVDDYPQSFALLDVVAQAQLSLVRYGEAVSTLEKLIETAPNSADARQRLAVAYAEVGESDKAIALYEQALEIDGGHGPSMAGLATLLLKQGDAGSAEPIVASLERAGGDSLAVGVMRLRLAKLAGDHQRATDLAAALQEGLRSEQDVIRLAGLRWQVGDADGGLDSLVTWLASRPQDLRAHLALSGYAIPLGRLNLAKRSLEAVVESNPDLLAARNDLAWVLMEQDNLDAALEQAEYARRLAPNEPAVLDTLGVIHLARGDVTQALGLLRRAAAGLPGNPDVAYHLAWALTEDGQTDPAREILEKILVDRRTFSERKDAEALARRLGS